MFKLITNLAETVVNVATLPVSMALDATCLPMIAGEIKDGEPISLTERNLKAIGRSFDKISEE